MTILKEERDQLFFDLCSGKKPSRVPIAVRIRIEAALEHQGYSLLRDLYSPKICYEVADEMARLFDSDMLPSLPANGAAASRYIGQKFMTPGDDGFFQHPNLSPMEVEEYPEFNKDPFKFIVDKIQPRVFDILAEDQVIGQLKMKIARDVVSSKFAGMAAALNDKHQRSNVFTMCLLSWAPFDFIADYIRNFSLILTDIRRNPQWVLDACEGVYEYEKKQIERLPHPSKDIVPTVNFPLHMPPYMKSKDVEKFWWPTFKKLIIATQNAGFLPDIFCEQNWDAHLDMLNDLPGRVLIRFESSNQEAVAKKVSTRHLYGDSYPAGLLRSGTKQQCIDEAKRIIDILAPAGNYLFCPNKELIRGKDFNTENLQAVIECVKEYGKY